MALRCAAVGMPPGDYSAIVADVVLVDRRVGFSSIPLRAECSNFSGSGSLLRRILSSVFVGGFVPLPVRALLQIHRRGYGRGNRFGEIHAQGGGQNPQQMQNPRFYAGGIQNQTNWNTQTGAGWTNNQRGGQQGQHQQQWQNNNQGGIPTAAQRSAIRERPPTAH